MNGRNPGDTFVSKFAFAAKIYNSECFYVKYGDIELFTCTLKFDSNRDTETSIYIYSLGGKGNICIGLRIYIS